MPASRAPLRAALLSLFLFLAPAPGASACSICRCGDPTFNALGSAIYSPGQFRLALDWDRFDKENGVSDPGTGEITGHDAEIENRFTLSAAYSFGERFTLVGRLPVSVRHLTSSDAEGTMTTNTTGLSDPDFTALFRIWASGPAPGLGRRAWVSLVAGVKTPWGRNNLSESGVRLDEHAQSGTGATDVYGGLSAAVLLDPQSSVFASFQYRRTGTNDYGYQYGRTTTANLAYERKLGHVVDAVVEVNGRHAEQDVVDADGNRDPNTGGDLVYLTPRLVIDLGGGFLARVAVQIPIVKSLYGEQTERANVNVGLTMLF
jgi:hypothetical protein